jgi:hypothetical protein
MCSKANKIEPSYKEETLDETQANVRASKKRRLFSSSKLNPKPSLLKNRSANL